MLEFDWLKEKVFVLVGMIVFVKEIVSEIENENVLELLLELEKLKVVVAEKVWVCVGAGVIV